jgi:hypothetical protein
MLAPRDAVQRLYCFAELFLTISGINGSQMNAPDQPARMSELD